jgi:hypothetical protein
MGKRIGKMPLPPFFNGLLGRAARTGLASLGCITKSISLPSKNTQLAVRRPK